MAHGLRSKSRRAFRTVKRQHIQQTVEVKHLNTLRERIQRLQFGEDIISQFNRPVNAFLNPDTPGASFPKLVPDTNPVDFRSEKLPISGFVGRGLRKKFTDAEKDNLIRHYNCIPGRLGKTSTVDTPEIDMDYESHTIEFDMDENIMAQASSAGIPEVTNKLKTQNTRVKHTARQQHKYRR